MPPGQIVKINLDQLSGELGVPLYGGYLELTDERPTAVSAPVPPAVPALSSGPHLAYAVQWFLFAIGVVVGVGYLARREAVELRESVTAPPRPPSPR